MSKHCAGDKICGKHTTAIDLTHEIVANIRKLQSIKKISLGMILPGKGKGGSNRRVKIVEHSWGILLTIRQSSSIQEVRLFVSDSKDTVNQLHTILENMDIEIHFPK